MRGYTKTSSVGVGKPKEPKVSVTNLRPNKSFNPDVASVSYFSLYCSGIPVSSHRAASATPVNSSR